MAVTLLIPLKKLYGDYQVKIQDTTTTPGIHAEYVVADHNIIAPISPPKAKFGPYDVCSCVSYIRWLTGIKFDPIKYAKNLPINAKTPQIGGIVVLNDSFAGHLAEVIQISVDNFTVKEANYYHCALSTRIISINAPDIMGFYNPE